MSALTIIGIIILVIILSLALLAIGAAIMWTWSFNNIDRIEAGMLDAPENKR